MAETNSKTKGNKRKLEASYFGAEVAVDSTAPLKQILRDLLNRERFSKAYNYYLHLLVRKRNLQANHLHYTLPGHPLKFFKDGWDGGVETSYFEAFPYKSTMPTIMSDMRNIDKTDPVTDQLNVKYNWINELNQAKQVIPVASSWKKVETLNDDVILCPKFVVDIAAKLESDPDPNFNSTYNWYYAGNGNMQLVCINWVDYLLHSEFNSVYLTRIHREDMTKEQNHIAKFDCDDKKNILETVCSSQGVVALRTLHQIVILRILEADDTVSFVKLKEFESEIAFTGVSFDKDHSNILYVSTLDSQLKIVNIDRLTARSVKLKRNTSTLLNNWNIVLGSERTTYMHIERKAISAYDKRTHGPVSTWNGVVDIVDEVFCNDITAAVHCADSPSLYFATDHHLFLMDARYSKTTSIKPVQRWTHGLRCGPTYFSIGKANHNKEFIVLSSQWCEDTCVVSNYADSVINNCDIRGVSVPYHPPSILNVYNSARMKMLCFDLQNPIDSRLTTSVTGQLVLEQGENLSILTHNSLGDIFFRTIYPEYMESFMEDNSVQKLHDWSQSFRIERKEFEVSGLRNIKNLWKKLKRVPEEYEFRYNHQMEYYDENKVLESFANEELIPELLDVWANDNDISDLDGSAVEQSSLALNLHYEDSDE